MKKIIFKTLFNVNRLYSIIWTKATGKDKFAFREESKLHEVLLAAMLLCKEGKNNGKQIFE